MDNYNQLPTTSSLTRSTSHPALTEDLHKHTSDTHANTDHFISRSTPSVYTRRTFNYVNIIVSGYHFKTLEETLQRFPETLLGNAKRRAKYWDDERQALVFHRCRQSFESILYFYQSEGSLIQPVNVEQEIFLDEAKFFKLPLLNYFMLEEQEIQPGKTQFPEQRASVLDKVYTAVEDTNTLGWKALALFDVGMTFVFVTLQCLRTEKSLRGSAAEVQIVASESTCIFWFMCIFLLRLLIAPDKKHFLFQFMSVVDVAVILAFIIDVVLFLKVQDDRTLIGLVTIVRLTGFLRLFNIARYSELLFCLGVALKRSLADLAQVMVLIFLVTFIFATLAYYIEEDNSETEDHTDSVEGGRSGCNASPGRKKNTFASVFDAIYWGTITIATVGYGDIYPKTAGGKSVGAALALLGLPLIAIPMPLIMSKFDGYYQDIKRKKENNEVRDKIMEELRDPPDSDDEEAHQEEGGGNTSGPDRHVLSPTSGEKNGSKHVTKHVQGGWYNHKNRSTSSLTSVGPLSPADRATMSWNDVVKEGYGWGMSHHHQQDRTNSFGYNTLHNVLNRSHSGTSSRICLSFSDLSRIFPSAETVTRGSQHGIHDPDNSSVSLPSLTDNYLSPMICYQKLEESGDGGDRVDLLNGSRGQVQRRSSTS